MGSFSIWHWMIVIVVVMLMFGGRGKISGLMGDFAQGIKAFKKGMAEDDKTEKAKVRAGQDDRQQRVRCVAGEIRAARRKRALLTTVAPALAADAVSGQAPCVARRRFFACA